MFVIEARLEFIHLAYVVAFFYIKDVSSPMETVITCAKEFH